MMDTFNPTVEEDDWGYYLNGAISGEYIIVIDYDDWWFQDIADDSPQSGGSGPYGKDLLEYLLEGLGIKWEDV